MALGDLMNMLAAILGILFIIGIVRAIQTHRLVRKAVRVSAKVVDCLDATVANPDTSSQTSPVSRYVVELQDHGGRKRRVIHRRVAFHRPEQVIRFLSLVRHPQQRCPGQLPLHRQVPLQDRGRRHTVW